MELQFYSSRKERLKLASKETQRAYENRNNKNFFKRNPHLKIMLIDLIIVLLFAVILLPLFLNIAKDTKYDDYKITETVISFEKNILISIKATKNYKKSEISNELKSVKVEIILNDNIIDSNDLILPVKSGDDNFLTFKILDDINLKFINIRYSVDDFEKTKKVLVKR